MICLLRLFITLTRLSQESNQVRAMLVRLAEHLKLRVYQGHVSSLGPYHSVLEQLSRIDVEKAKGAQIRSGIHWVEEGESSALRKNVLRTDGSRR